jgi:SAM-dependent methyltransferase
VANTELAGVHFAAFESENTPVPRLMGLANGTILELGPGSGNQLPRFDCTVVSKIYGIEPNEYLFNQLRDETIGKHGWTDVYVPIHGALEDQKLLDSFGVLSGSMDTIVCMQVLCSVSDVSEAVKQIHRLLKPGGQLLFWEHTVSRDMTTRWVQGKSPKFCHSQPLSYVRQDYGHYFGSH